MRRPTAVLLLSSALLVSACSSPEQEPDAGPALPSADVCDQVEATEIPAECLPGADAPRRRPTGPPPAEGTAAFDFLRIETIPGELGRVDNNAEDARTAGTLRVTVPAGARLGLQVACEGFTTFTAKTEPDSDAEVELDCGFEGAPAELGVESPKVESAATTYVITVGAPAPARWAVVAYETNETVVDNQA